MSFVYSLLSLPFNAAGTATYCFMDTSHLVFGLRSPAVSSVPIRLIFQLESYARIVFLWGIGICNYHYYDQFSRLGLWLYAYCVAFQFVE